MSIQTKDIMHLCIKGILISSRYNSRPFMPSLSHITTLDWGVSALSYTCFTQLFSRTDLSSLQRLHLDFDNHSASEPEIISWLEALTSDQRRADCFLLRLKTIYIEMYNSDQMIFEALYNCLRSRRLEDNGGTLKALQHNNVCAVKTLTWEGYYHLKKPLMDELKDLVDGGLRINFVTRSVYN